MHRYEVIVADNASFDGTAEHLRHTHPEVLVLDMGSNRGFATANERAYRRAGGRHVLLLNGDTFVGEHTVDHMIEFLDRIRPRVRSHRSS